MFCPNCGSHLSCDCKACKGTNNVAIKLFKEKLYKCPLCEKKFSEGESLDYEWDRMIEGWAKVATRSHCLEWLDKRKIEEGLDFSEVTMRMCSSIISRSILMILRMSKRLKGVKN